MTTDLPGLPGPPRARAPARCRAGTFDGASVFVTGGGTGLGKAIALEFARLGASIVIASRKPEHLEAGQEAIDALGGAGDDRRVRHPRPRADRGGVRRGRIEAYGLPGSA